MLLKLFIDVLLYDTSEITAIMTSSFKRDSRALTCYCISMAYRRRRPRLIPDHSDSGQISNVEQLAFKYKEMCKVESSTDSDSEISPRWSDTSTMECVSSAPESGSLRRTLPRVHESAGRQGCYSLFLDPYDGSSEDSDETNMDASTPKGQTRQQGKGGRGRIFRRTRHFILHPPLSTDFRPLVKQTKTTSQHLLDVHMKCLDDSEVWLCQLSKDMTGSQPEAAGLEAHDRLHGDTQMPDSSLDSTAGPCDVRVVVKRKPDVPCSDSLVLRKRLCVVRVEEEKEG